MKASSKIGTIPSGGPLRSVAEKIYATQDNIQSAEDAYSSYYGWPGPGLPPPPLRPSIAGQINYGFSTWAAWIAGDVARWNADLALCTTWTTSASSQNQISSADAAAVTAAIAVLQARSDTLASAPTRDPSTFT